MIKFYLSKDDGGKKLLNSKQLLTSGRQNARFVCNLFIDYASVIGWIGFNSKNASSRMGRAFILYRNFG